jgi:G3E family GTPase
MKKVRVILTGGFLGAGKTTSVIQLANILHKKGIKVGIITNDQGTELVDGRLVKAKGLLGAEVTGGCFCCRFDDFLKEVNSLIDEYEPEVLIAEPVGSCTDLVSTVFLPLQKYYPDNFILAPFTVITDGRLLYQALTCGNFPFSDEILYLYKCQIEECNILLVNKSETLEEKELQWLLKELTNKYPGKTIIPVSALSGDGFENWTQPLLQSDFNSNALQEIDYDKYGMAESLLGWYNSSVCFKGSKLFDANDIVQELLEKIALSIKEAGGNIAHLKAIAETKGGIIKAGIAGLGKTIDFTQSAYDLTREMSLLVNARVEILPETLTHIIHSNIEQCCTKLQLEVRYGYEECFKPSFPNPTYRGV